MPGFPAYVHWRTESKFKFIGTNWRRSLETIKCKRMICEVLCSTRNNPYTCRLKDGYFSSMFSERRQEAAKGDSATAPQTSRQLAMGCDQRHRRKVIQAVFEFNKTSAKAGHRFSFRRSQFKEDRDCLVMLLRGTTRLFWGLGNGKLRERLEKL